MGRKEVTKAFQKKLTATHADKFTLVGEYTKSSVKTDFRCNLCSTVFEYTPNNVLRFCKNGCPSCTKAGSATKHTKGPVAYAAEVLHIYGYTLKVVGTYTNAKTALSHQCGICEFVFQERPNKVLSGLVKCPKCLHLSDTQNIAHLTRMGYPLIEAASIAYPSLAFQSVGANIREKAKFVCRTCNTKQYRNLLTLKRSPCTACGVEAKRQNLRHSHDDYVGRIRKIWGNKVQVVGSYISTNRKVRHKCLTCFNTWKVSPLNSLHRNSGCPYCATVTRRKNLSRACLPKAHQLGERTVHVQGYEPQALTYMVSVAGMNPDDIEVESGGNVPVVEYRIRNRRKRYFPDMFIPKTNTIVEVKSTYTLGFGETRRHRKYWKMNCAKAIACHDQGYKFALLLMDGKGNRVQLPKGWPRMTCREVMNAVQSSRQSSLS